MNIQLPSFLQKGDKVVIVSPSSKIDKEFLKRAKKRLESWGLKVSVGKYAGGSSGRYAGTIRQRLQDLQSAMDDPKVKAILCSREDTGPCIWWTRLTLPPFVNIRSGCWDSATSLPCIIYFRRMDMPPCIR